VGSSNAINLLFVFQVRVLDLGFENQHNLFVNSLSLESIL